VVIRQPRRFRVHSGELLVGLISEMDRVPSAGQWNWVLSGTRPNPSRFVWKSTEKTLDEARAAQAGRMGGMVQMGRP
jgi:hypothetical protein